MTRPVLTTVRESAADASRPQTTPGLPEPAPRSVPRLHRPDSAPSLCARRRAIWHQRLIDAEGGIRLAMRSSSTLYLHLFCFSVVGLSCAVLGVAWLEWLLVAAAMLATVAAELFNLAIHTLVSELSPAAPAVYRKTSRLSTAATLTVLIAASIVFVSVVGRHVWQLFQ